MTCHCEFLSEEKFPQIAGTFDEAFADYYQKSTRKAETWLFNRAAKNGVEWDYSVGAFDGERMVGITLIGISEWMGKLAAFDAGTGIVPDYRGRGLAAEMFQLAVPKLKQRGVTKFLLEVLQVNEPAIKAYQKSGFKITREFDCLGLKKETFSVEANPKLSVEIKPLRKDRVAQLAPFADWQPSWENMFSSIERIPDDVVINGAFLDGELVGAIGYYPLLNWIVTLVVKPEYRRQGTATYLLKDFVDNFDRDIAQINLVNVDRSDSGMLAFLERMGFESFTSQYEMELEL
ncbi:MAG: GNAT family N-acetyltransferase [Candidatus Zixiibacteriota bacterium]